MATMNYRVIVKFDGTNPQAFEYKHVDGAMNYAQAKTLHETKGFDKVTVADLKTNKVIYAYYRRNLWGEKIS